MDELDKKILNIIQGNFPLVSSPYKELASILGVSEEEILERLKNLMAGEIIRQIGPVFSSKHLNYKSTLAAMEVPSEKLPEVVEIINSYPQVTHNYGRRHKYNLWFTLIGQSDDEICCIIEEIKSRSGIDRIYSLPQKKLFKIKVDFAF